jgi:hypothetical protein
VDSRQWNGSEDDRDYHTPDPGAPEPEALCPVCECVLDSEPHADECPHEPVAVVRERLARAFEDAHRALSAAVVEVKEIA